jgi:alpha-D-ribose 1-methylphosphonate 5-triphosphate synthase subunit PhnI
MYVSVTGGEKAIAEAHRQLAQARRGDPAIPDLSIAAIKMQMGLAVDRVMQEGALHDPDLAALAIKQARGDLVEAIFLLRAYRTTLTRFGTSEVIDTARMRVRRRISAVFKDVPGGQILGPTFDYTHRLLDFSLLDGEDGTGPAAPGAFDGDVSEAIPAGEPVAHPLPAIASVLAGEDLLEHPAGEGDALPGDLTRTPLEFPAGRDIRLQALARGDEGFLLALAYSSQRGFGNTHPFVGEIRMGSVAVSLVPEELGFAIEIGEIDLTECDMVTQFAGGGDEPPRFTRGYGLAFGEAERKAMAMALVDRSLRAGELGEPVDNPAQDEEFVLYHADNVEAQGFVQHLKLPHYVDFQAEMDMVRDLRARFFETGAHASQADEEGGA